MLAQHGLAAGQNGELGKLSGPLAGKIEGRQGPGLEMLGEPEAGVARCSAVCFRLQQSLLCSCLALLGKIMAKYHWFFKERCLKCKEFANVTKA